MSLAAPSVLDVAKIQYRHKLKAYTNFFLTMIAAQALALLFSSGGTGSMGTGFNHVSVTLRFYSSDIIVVFTGFWAFVMATYITTKEYKDADFAFVANRLSTNLSNLAFLATASIIGGTTAILGGSVLRVIAYYILGSENIAFEYFNQTPWQLLLSIAVTALYLFLLCALGYLVGSLVQLSKSFIVLLPGLFFGTLIVAVRSGYATLLIDITSFYLDESSLSLLVVKILLTCALFFAGAFAISNRTEVRT